MNKEILKSICILLMCDDPTNLKKGKRAELEEWLDSKVGKFGYTDWVHFYHEE